MSTTSTLRAALRAKFGARQYRIHSDGSISVYGRAPNSIATCWYLFGFVNDTLTLAALGLDE